jgi:hypothetical protein
MNETKLRERLFDLAADAPRATTMPPRLARRARRRIALTVISSIALVAVLVAGGILSVRGLRGGGNQAAVRPTETPTSTATPLPPEGALKPGNYVLDNPAELPSLRITFTVPRAWRGFELGALRGVGPRHMGVTFWLVDSVYADPCHVERGLVAVGPTVDDLANALANQPRRHGTAPTDASVDGYAGKYVELTVPQHINFTDCDSGQFRSWRTPTGGLRWQQGPGQVDQLWILDVQGTRLVMDATYMPGTSARDRAELRQIVASVHIDALP